jgi:predicted Holliday junction resolvase-like endonuclease
MFEEFQEFRKILCICPCCGEIVKVSDLRLKAKGPTIKTWLDIYEQKLASIEKKEEKFEEKEKQLREKSREKGRKEAEKIIHGMIPSSIRNMKIDLKDLIPIMHPVDFVVFEGMNKKDSISDILFLSKKVQISYLQVLRNQVKSAITQKQYSWQVVRINNEGKLEFE